MGLLIIIDTDTRESQAPAQDSENFLWLVDKQKMDVSCGILEGVYLISQLRLQELKAFIEEVYEWLDHLTYAIYYQYTNWNIWTQL